MMISVKSLSKRYAGVLAVDNISFEIEKGQVVGFLGPNGAGKTTTMRILTCFQPPSAGTATVAGFDVMKDSLEVRRRIGYLPENVPLYPEMRVEEYLAFRARLKGVPPGLRKKRIDICVERCGLGPVRRRIVGQLSKGFRQRVGFAEAMVHDPPILILDEPTIGLDPNQIRTIRTLIQELGRDHTVILSTHILPEVEMVCDRVVIISRGRIVTQEATKNLARVFTSSNKVILEVRAPQAEVESAVMAMPGVRAVALKGVSDDGQVVTVRVETDGPQDRREALHRLAVEKGWPLRGLSLEQVSLEEIFVQVTSQAPPPAAAAEAKAS
jgi:ABC-2 type transport system ATP-binding protein